MSGIWKRATGDGGGWHLQDAVHGVESQASKGGHAVLLVVFVVDVMQQPAGTLNSTLENDCVRESMGSEKH